MLKYQKLTTGLAFTIIIGGCAGTRSILVEETLEIDGRSRITWSNNEVIDVYGLSAVGDSVVATDLKSQTEIRAHKDYILSVSIVNHARGGLRGILRGGAIGIVAGAGLYAVEGRSDAWFPLSTLAVLFGFPVGGVLGVIAGDSTIYTFVPSGQSPNNLIASPNDVELPEWVPPGSLPTEPNTHLAGGGYIGKRGSIMGRYRRFVSAQWLHLPDAQASANLPGGPYRYYFSVGARSLYVNSIEKSGELGMIFSELMSLSLGVEGYRQINGLWDPTAFVELGLINGRVYRNTILPGIQTIDNTESSSGPGVVATLGGRLYGKVMFGEVQVTLDSRTAILIPSMVLGIRF